jgi:hypothetical protein
VNSADSIFDLVAHPPLLRPSARITVAGICARIPESAS